MHRIIIHLLVFVTLILLLIDGGNLPSQTESVSHHPVFSDIAVRSDEAQLRQEIEAVRKEVEKPSENARIDKIWKKIPGKAGVKVDVDASVEKMQKTGTFDRELLVLEEVEPEVTLDELPASPIYRAREDQEQVALLINVSWGEEHIPPILQTLKDAGVKANFFLEGKWAKENNEIVEMIEEEGHVIGNHAYNHPDMKQMNKADSVEQITQTNEIINAITGDKPTYFAPPSGSFNQGVIEAAAEQHMETILWSVDTIDWQKPTVPVMMKRVTEKLHPGAFILMHPTPVVEAGLADMLKVIEEKGYSVSTLDTILNEGR
ncbi:probable sporulation protein, polysaccharide deacetylase family [Terribacillus aidingensis]|uniref:Probable sporulation protein, polysaccharide deacetylase family n=1 Tax=Terribacillus aidingensis TaxID=586416 RepID=A0A285NLD7_9BACI|nr:polysaccharide deacetylase family protein [Terribacillus aidingensis]SNZ09757.1 probable sporulation protein, polysaccharide deacetylase family [Terribacillus aidingensis]